ncbi:MAG: IreB family regulatory phosphoprotein [Clostridiaceae bacterium]|nr:IreB family regulatory phosphoprotein [Clostridiaceae bacterium]
MNSGTMKFDFNNENTNQTREVILKVYEALTEKGYNPISQLVGYIMSGDPTYITSHKNARSLIRRLERDEIIEELVRYYIK